MPSSFPSSNVKQKLTKGRNSFIALLIGICYFFAAFLLYIGSEELYKLNTLVIRHCQVKSVDVKYQRNSFYPRWNITLVDENEARDGFLIVSISTRSSKWAWIKARKYKVNETYPCYRSQNKTSIIQWGWQWNKPTKLKTYALLFCGVTLLTIGTVLFILRRRYQTEFKNTQEQQEHYQLETPLRIEEQQQATASSQSPPPTYDKAIQ